MPPHRVGTGGVLRGRTAAQATEAQAVTAEQATETRAVTAELATEARAVTVELAAESRGQMAEEAWQTRAAMVELRRVAMGASAMVRVSGAKDAPVPRTRPVRARATGMV